MGPIGIERHMVETPFGGGRHESARRRGFSLLEIVIAISIGAILLAIGLPMLRRNSDTRTVSTLAQRLQAMLNEARQTAQTRGTVLISPVDGTFAQCQGLRAEVPGTDAYTHTLMAENGACFFGGPPISPIAVARSGEFDVTQTGYFGIKGSNPENVAFVTFNQIGSTKIMTTPPGAQMASTAVGTITTTIIAALGSASSGSAGSVSTFSSVTLIDHVSAGMPMPSPPTLGGGQGSTIIVPSTSISAAH